MIFNQLFLICWIHSFKWIELALKVTFELTAGLYDLVHYLYSLLLAHSWSKWITSHISSDPDPGGLNHGGLVLGEGWAFELGVVHVAHMLVFLFMLVVVLNHFVENVAEVSVGLVATSIDTDS